MAIKHLNDNVLVDEYCDIGEDNCNRPKYLQVCYRDYYNCPHWKRIFKPLWQVQKEQKQAKEGE